MTKEKPSTPTDQQVLWNSVYFGTKMRSFFPMRVLRDLAGPLDEFARMALHLEAFQLWVTSTEDVISWVWSLKRWQPDGPVEKRLFALTRYPGAKEILMYETFLDPSMWEPFGNC